MELLKEHETLLREMARVLIEKEVMTLADFEEVLAGVSLEFARAIGFTNHDIRECILETEMLNIKVLDELGIAPESTIPAHKHDEE